MTLVNLTETYCQSVEPHLIKLDLQRFIVENIEGKSTEANDLSHILKRWVCCVNNSECCQRFPQINEELKIMEIILPKNQTSNR